MTDRYWKETAENPGHLVELFPATPNYQTAGLEFVRQKLRHKVEGEDFRPDLIVGAGLVGVVLLQENKEE